MKFLNLVPVHLVILSQYCYIVLSSDLLSYNNMQLEIGENKQLISADIQPHNAAIYYALSIFSDKLLR